MDASTKIDVDTTNYMDIDGAHLVGCMRGDIFSARAKPAAKNKYQKRLGAKNAKKPELDERTKFTLNAADATMYRALSVRCNYHSQDRPELACSSKELCRKFNTPNMNSFKTSNAR